MKGGAESPNIGSATYSVHNCRAIDTTHLLSGLRVLQMMRLTSFAVHSLPLFPSKLRPTSLSTA